MRIISVIGIESFSAFWKSSENALDSATLADAPPNSPTRTSGCAGADGGDVAHDRLDRLLRRRCRRRGSSKDTTTERPSLEIWPALPGA